MKANTHYNFDVTHVLDFEIFEEKSAVSSTYEIQFEQLESKNLHIEIRRNNFKVNGEKIESKLEKIFYEYTNAIFPVLFNIEERNFSLSNYAEIAERIVAKDEELKLEHDCVEFHDIRNGFLENAARDGHSMTQYFFSLGLMKVIMLCFQKTENHELYNFYWDIVPLETTLSWEGKIKYNSTSKTLSLEGYEIHKNELFEKIKAYGVGYQYPQKITEEDTHVIASVKNKTKFVNTKLDLEFSETVVEINNQYFNYHETLSINRNY